MRNLGPTTLRWLADLGLTTEEAILAEDPIAVARALRRAGHPASLNLVYALAGARLGLPWNALPPEIRLSLANRWNTRRTVLTSETFSQDTPHDDAG